MVTKTMRVLGSLALLVALVAACGDHRARGSVGPIDGGVANLNRAWDSYVVQYCECYADELYNGDVATCEEAEGGDDYTLNDCERKVAECYVDEFTELHECRSAAISDYEECYASCPETQTHVEHCESEYTDSANECWGALSQHIHDDLVTCDRGETFTCYEQ